MYSDPSYYALLLLSFITFISYIYGVYKNNKIKVEFVDTSIIDNKAYWVYNNKLYYGKVEKNTLNNNTISEVNTFGMQAEEAFKIFKDTK